MCICMYDASHRVSSKSKSSGRDSLTIEVVVGRFGSHIEDGYQSENDKGQQE